MTSFKRTYASTLWYIFLICASILFLRSWVIFTIIILDSFLGGLTVSSLFSCSFRFLFCRDLSIPSTPHEGCRYHPTSSPLPLPSFFHPTLYVGIFLVLLGVQGPLLAFSRCCVGTASRVDVFLIHLWGERNSMSSYSSTILEKTHLPFNKSILLIFFWNLIFSIVR